MSSHEYPKEEEEEEEVEGRERLLPPSLPPSPLPFHKEAIY